MRFAGYFETEVWAAKSVNNLSFACTGENQIHIICEIKFAMVSMCRNVYVEDVDVGLGRVYDLQV